MRTEGAVVHTCNPSIWNMEAGRSAVQGHLWVCKEFKASLGYRDPIIIEKERRGKQYRALPEELPCAGRGCRCASVLRCSIDALEGAEDFHSHVSPATWRPASLKAWTGWGAREEVCTIGVCYQWLAYVICKSIIPPSSFVKFAFILCVSVCLHVCLYHIHAVSEEARGKHWIPWKKLEPPRACWEWNQGFCKSSRCS